MKRILLSFESRLTFYILTLATLTFLCIAAVFFKYSREREESQAITYTTALQEKLIQKVDFELDRVENTVKSQLYRVRNVKADPDNIMPIIKSMVASDSLITSGSIAFVRDFYPDKGERFMEHACKETVDGEQRLVTKHLADSTYNYLHMPWFTEALKSNRGIWSDPYYDKVGGGRTMISYTVPVADEDDKVFAVISADVSLESLSLNIFSIRPYPDSYSFVVSRNGLYISHPDKSLILRSSVFDRAHDLGNDELMKHSMKMLDGQQGSFRSEVGGEDMLACYAPLPRTGWSVCSVCPYHTVMAQVGSTFWVMVAILLGGLVMLSLCIHSLVKFTVKPIQQLTEATKQIANGNFESKLPEIDTKDDLRHLHDAFAHMQRSLLNYIDELKATTRQKERIKSELNIANNIQMSIVPKVFSPFPSHDKLDLYADLKPAREVGGDLYEFFIRDDKLFFCVGDVSGKGIPASLVMAITSTLFRITASSFDTPDIVVSKLNDTLSANNEANMFVTMFAGVLHLNTGRLTYCNAGHNPPVVIRKDGTCHYLQMNKNLPVGVVGGIRYECQEMQLTENEALLAYTDGLTEAENASHELFGEQRTLDTVARHAASSARELIGDIKQELDTFVGNAEQSDDLTLLCVRLTKGTADKEQDAYPCGKTTEKLTVANEIGESQKLEPFVETIGARLQLPPQTVMSINLALEEMLVNTIQYAYPEGTKGEIELSAHWDGEQPTHVTFKLTDHGAVFDPTKVESPDTTLGAAERPTGGLGIFLARKMMDEVEYARKDGENILVMKKYLKAPLDKEDTITAKDMKSEIETNGSQTLIKVAGRLDTVNAGMFQKQIDEQPLATHVTIDCDGLEYISSSGLRAFISILKRAQQDGGDVKVTNLNSSVKEVFDMTGFSTLFGM